MKPCTVKGCGRPSRARGLCHMHWMRWRRHGTTEQLRPPSRKGQCVGSYSAADGRLEDLRWMLDTGEHPERACQRLSLTPGALARWLTRHGEPELARIFWGVAKQRQAAA